MSFNDVCWSCGLINATLLLTVVVFLLVYAALTMVNLVAKTFDWDLVVTAIMSTSLKYGCSAEKITSHIYMTCTKKQ